LYPIMPENREIQIKGQIKLLLDEFA
jgi:hypothetical protein